MSAHVNPQHYRAGTMEAIDVIEAFNLGFRLGNVVKYVLRADRKGAPLQDLEGRVVSPARDREAEGADRMIKFKIRRPERTKESCDRKVRYGRMETALAACVRMEKKGSPGLSPYHCQICGGHHIGHDAVAALEVALKNQGYTATVEDSDAQE